MALVRVEFTSPVLIKPNKTASTRSGQWAFGEENKTKCCVFCFFLQSVYLTRLNEIRDTLEISPFFKTHEVKTHCPLMETLITLLCTDQQNKTNNHEEIMCVCACLHECA